MHSIRDTLLRHAATATPWYVIIDAAQDHTGPERAAQAGLRTQSLYAGNLGAELDDVAPHLATFDLQSPFSGWLLDRWSGNHGILLQSKARFEDLRRHLRKFTLVKREGGKRCRFRFYDPRVLRAFLPACSFEEAEAFFGPVDRFYAVDRSGAAVLAFGWGQRGLTVRELVFEREVPFSRTEPRLGPVAVHARKTTGSLTVTVVDAESEDPIVGASVGLAGAATLQAISGPLGKTRFASIVTGDYEVFAIDAELRYGRATVSVTARQTAVRLRCE